MKKFNQLKWIKSSIALIAVLIAAASCNTDDVLDKLPVTEITADNAFNTEKDVLGSLTSVYDPLQWQFVNGAHTFPQMFQSIRSDDEHSQQAAFWAIGANFDQFNTILPTNASVAGVWSKWYQGVARANFTIKLANEFPNFETDGLRDKIIGEAKFLRGLYYFELVRLFGGVPLFTEPITSTEDELFKPRSKTAEVYTQIENDLRDAADVLPMKGETDQWRATSGAALGILAKVHLYQGEYSDVVRLTEEVMTHGYSLEENFGDNFKLNNEFGKESLFEINYVDGLVGGGFETPTPIQEGSGSWKFMFMFIDSYESFGNMLPRRTLVEFFDDSDSRKEATFILPGSRTFSPGLEARGWDPAPASFPFAIGNDAMSRKFFLTFEEVDGLLSPFQSPLNEKVLRYADILLMHAEASLMGGGGDGSSSFQQVIDRAYGPGNSAAPAYDLQGIKDERRRELATEGWNRFSDLVRWGDAKQAIDAVGKTFTIGRDELLPIPQVEIDVYPPGMLEQNPGY
ncbi:RagB/SusD family nutrient uptake outer membrane protein [Aquimarina sp. MMG016]|uniref:RagB/SusD family nutrient uptake outer membrane protein n=1 Tax=Aquimarina sp. MMG016 TaxID=2822690 RepID=UPI001B3A3406|nr:RagB/SusD family nutrient uptake outer membrane protein [Aquimarina sp. MMG016]MBQ4818565.1 RagB/SusD family nutrient uptake outer membrane protein [Aquimarina sp. MMG016]